MPITAKICGLSTPEAIHASVANGASHIGFIFYPASPRNISPEQAGQWQTPAQIGRVGVFVDPDDGFLSSVVAAARLTMVQLHGGESPERVAAIKALLGLDVWKAISVRTRADLDVAKAYKGAADQILYDAKTPKGMLPGGMGLRFDWRLLDGLVHPLPWALSGGLDVDNVADAVSITGARLVDVSSGVETAPGVKNVDKIAAFLQATGRL